MNRKRHLTPLLHLTTVLALAFTVTPARPGAAQEPSREFGGAVEVREVLLDVLVTDEDGSVIVGLDEGDFLVESGGEPVEVTSAVFYSNRVLTGGLGGLADAGAVDTHPEDRYFVLFFYRPPQEGARDFDFFVRLIEAGRLSFQWVAEELLPNDRVAVVGFDRELALYHDFTLDHQRLGEAIRRACRGKEAQRWTSRIEEPAVNVSLASLREAPADEERNGEEEDVYVAVNRVAEALGEIPGRKNLILFGVEFPRLGSLEAEESYEPMVRALNDNNVAVYSIGIVRRGRQESLERLSEDTGGTYAFSFKSYLDPLRRIARENSGYYLLSFRSEHPAGESGYRQVAVRTTNPHFQVRARSGYLYGD